VRFLLPARLWLLLLPAWFVAAYLVALGRKHRHVVRFTTVELLDRVAPDRPGWRRHLPAALFVGALAVTAVALARPVTTVRVPREEATVIVAVDVSLSMQATDVPPSRLEAAQEAARRFVDLAPGSLRVGLVPFAGSALPAVAPTTDKAEVKAGIDRLRLAEGTAVGEAIYAALDLVAREEQDVGEDVPAAIVVLSDGTTTMGRDSAAAAQAAAAAGVPVSTISFGTASGAITYQGDLIPVPPDEAALRAVAEATGGRFFTAASVAELQQILDDIGSRIGFVSVDREVWEWFLAAGLVFLVAAGAGSLLWFSRLP